MQRQSEQNIGSHENGGDDRLWLVIGDIHDETGNLARIPELAKADAIIISGDLTQLGGVPQAEKVLEKLKDPGGKRIYAQIGNMDKPEIDSFLSRNGHNLHCNVFELAPDVAIFGIGGSTITPFHTPSEFTEDDYARWLEKSWDEAGKYPHQILVSHNPPHDTACDLIGSGAHVGSKAVREFLEKRQPDLCVCGHIHESRASDHIGRTQILNPGMFADGGYVAIHKHGDTLKAEIKSVRRAQAEK